MPQRNQLTWGELRVGIFVLAGLVLLIVAIFYVTGFGDLTREISPGHLPAQCQWIDGRRARERGRN